jgi:pimeloyl-ACP methyl ester carboxylesterase
MAMYEGFRGFDLPTSDPGVTIHGVVGGAGPPLLLLHGNPLTHIHWRLVAPRLAEQFTVVATDLRGYGDSGKPRGLPDHSNYAFRRMAQDQVEVMQQLGFERFRVAGHDRGARAGFRMALDHPERVLELACIDILPTHHVWTHVSREWALNAYHWAFMAQPYDFPEQLLAGKEEYYIRLKLGSQGLGKGGISEEALREYVRCCTPANIHAVRGLPGRRDDRLRDGHAGPRGRPPDRLPAAGDRRRPQPHREVLQRRGRVGAVRDEPGALHRAAVRALPRRAGAGRDRRRAQPVLRELTALTPSRTTAA